MSHHDRRPVRSWPETVGHRRQRAALGRIWNYWLGGKDNYPVDREAGDQFSQVFPNILAVTRASRAFLARAVEYLARDAQIQQFLDIVTGLPTADNTHEVAQRLAPASRIVYVDNDPVVLVHARALLTSTGEGRTAYIDATCTTRTRSWRVPPKPWISPSQLR